MIKLTTPSSKSRIVEKYFFVSSCILGQKNPKNPKKWNNNMHVHINFIYFFKQVQWHFAVASITSTIKTIVVRSYLSN